MPSPRPALLEYASHREMFLAFEQLFLGGNEAPAPHVLHSPCGHEIHIRNHHFFHLVGLEDRDRPDVQLTIADDLQNIFAADLGNKRYPHEKQRAVHLPVAALALWEPDEIWDNPELRSARWVYFKEFDQAPYTHLVFLVGYSTERRENKREIVPYTFMPMRYSRGNKKRHGTLLYSRNTNATVLRVASDTRGDCTR